MRITNPVLEKIQRDAQVKSVLNTELRESEEKYHSLFENSPISFMEEDFSQVKVFIDKLKSSGVKDIGKYFERHPQDLVNCVTMVKIKNVNRATHKLYKTNNSKELLENLELLFDSTSFQVFKEGIIRLDNGETKFNAMAVNKTLNGEKIDINITWALAQDHEKTWSRVWVSMMDITQQKQAEQALFESETRFRALFEQAAVGVAQIESKTGVFIRINQQYCDIIGYTPQEMLNMSFQQITHPDDLQEDLDNMQLLLKNDITKFSIEKRYLHKNGSIVWVKLSVTPMWGIEQKPDYHIAVVENITERKQIEEKLREEKEFTKNILESSLNGLYIYNFDKHANIYINPQYTALTGYTLKNLSTLNSQDFSALFYLDDLPIIQQHLSDIMLAKDNEVLEIEYRFKHINGEWLWFLFKDAVFKRNPDGTVREFIGTFLDITYRKKSEIQIRESLKEKETLLKELYHRTKNNMQVIMAMINLQTQNNEDETILQIFKETNNRINTMALVHEKLYQAKNLSKIDLKGYFTDLINLLRSSYQDLSEGIGLKTDMDTVLVTIDSAIQIGRAHV